MAISSPPYRPPGRPPRRLVRRGAIVGRSDAMRKGLVAGRLALGRAICGILSPLRAGSSMAEQLTLNQLVGSSSLPRLTTRIRSTKRPSDRVSEGRFNSGPYPTPYPSTRSRRDPSTVDGIGPLRGPSDHGVSQVAVQVRRRRDARVAEDARHHRQLTRPARVAAWRSHGVNRGSAAGGSPKSSRPQPSPADTSSGRRWPRMSVLQSGGSAASAVAGATARRLTTLLRDGLLPRTTTSARTSWPAGSRMRARLTRPDERQAAVRARNHRLRGCSTSRHDASAAKKVMTTAGAAGQKDPEHPVPQVNPVGPPPKHRQRYRAPPSSSRP